MKHIMLEILNKYLEIFPDEMDRQSRLMDYLNSYQGEEVIDWNNFDGHVVAGGFVYAKEEKKFLVLYHKDLNMYLYPGGHIDKNDENTLEASKREIKEETSLSNLEQFVLGNSELVPIDIDTHMIDYNQRLNLPEHYHFDFRYLFMIEKIEQVVVDGEELGDYRWIDVKELMNDPNYGRIANKIEKLIEIDNKRRLNL